MIKIELKDDLRKLNFNRVTLNQKLLLNFSLIKVIN